MYIPWLIWLAMATVVAGQVVRGVALDSLWRPWYRRVENPQGFWTVIVIQTALLLTMALVWTWIIASEG